jgi:hypothetical protein
MTGMRLMNIDFSAETEIKGQPSGKDKALVVNDAVNPKL